MSTVTAQQTLPSSATNQHQTAAIASINANSNTVSVSSLTPQSSSSQSPSSIASNTTNNPTNSNVNHHYHHPHHHHQHHTDQSYRLENSLNTQLLINPASSNGSGSNQPAQITPNNSNISSNNVTTSSAGSTPTNSSGAVSSANMSGFLLKWTNYIKGYQKRWFILHNGILSYFRSPTEMQHTCRGAISLENAQIQGDEFNNFVVSNGTNQTFHLRAANEPEKQRWMNALELAKKAKQSSSGGMGGGSGNYGNLFFSSMFNQNESDDDEDTIEAEKSELESMLHTMQEKLNELNLSQDFVQKHINALNKSLNELNNLQTKPEDLTIKTINERSGICKIALIGLSTHCQEFIKLARLQARKMNKISELEKEQRMR